jgi:hypothetical protein
MPLRLCLPSLLQPEHSPGKPTDFSIKKMRRDKRLETNCDSIKSQFALVAPHAAEGGSPGVVGSRMELKITLAEAQHAG